MTNRTYRTAQGRHIDFGALILRNEEVRAVGNMKVNARGDVLDDNNRVIDTRQRQVTARYRRQITDEPAASQAPRDPQEKA